MIEALATQVGDALIVATDDGPTRRAAIKLAAERFGFTVSDETDIEAAAAALGIEL